MPGGALQIVLLCILAAVLMGSGVWLLLRCRRDPAERERQRRIAVNRGGRMGDATITDVRDRVLYYSYQVRGVAYTASQDVSPLLERLPGDLSTLIGASGLKYDPRNPANSILMCEEWSGWRARHLAASTPPQ